MSRIQSRCKHPQRCVIGHPFNPPHLMPLSKSSAAMNRRSCDCRTIAFYRSIGKYPIHIRKEVRGHIANRLQAALWREAIHLMDSGVASVADIDAAVAYGPGLRWAFMGPSLTFHLAGGEGGMQYFLDHLGDAVPELVRRSRRSFAHSRDSQATRRRGRRFHRRTINWRSREKTRRLSHGSDQTTRPLTQRMERGMVTQW